MAQVRMWLRDAEAGNLPAVCVCCGSAAVTTKSKQMQWFPPWVYILILAGLLPYAIVASVLTKKARVQAPFCEDHKGHWFNRSALMWGTFFLFLVLSGAGFIFGMNLERHQQDLVMPWVCVGGTVLFTGWLVTVIVCAMTAIRPCEITDREVTLTGVSDAFADAVFAEAQEQRSRRQERRTGSWRDEADDLPPPPSRRGPEDAFER